MCLFLELHALKEYSDLLSSVAPFIKNTKILKDQWNPSTHSRDPITYMYLKELWRNSILKVGTTKQMRHRAKIFKNLYLDNPRFYFGLSTAHLTLGIDRFAGMGKSLGKKLKWFKKRRLYKDLIIWGNELRKINQKMTQLIVFSKSIFEAKKIYSEETIINSIIHDRKIFKDFAEIYSLLPLWDKIESLNNQKTLIQIAGKFIEWEHRHIIQPRLEMSLLKIGETFERMLKNIPGKIVEKPFLSHFKSKQLSI